MMTFVLLLLAAGAVAAAVQHFRYLGVRRSRVDDHQPLLHSGNAFHEALLLKVSEAEGREGALAVLGDLREAVEAPGGGQVVYAGLVALPMAPSTRLSNDWSAFLLTQYPNRVAFDRRRRSDAVQEILARCENTAVYGFQRQALVNLLIPIGLGVLRLRDILLRAEPILPFQPVSEEEALEPLRMKRKEIEALDAYRDIREDSVVIINLIKPGTKEEREADRGYTTQMMRGMAEGGYGPMHLGRAVTIEGDIDFRQFAAVYYPGINHMHAMLGSRFMNRIAAGKQLGDTLAVATIPVTSRI